MTPRSPEAVSGYLTSEDLIADRALRLDETDELQHLPIALRVADLVIAVDPPANIALFGPWGSGKSSFAQLLRGCFGGEGRRVDMVIYDAWTFEGESFQRNFISAAAAALTLEESDERNREFYGGLYEGRQSGRISLTRWDILKLLGLATGITALALVFLVALVAGIAHVLGEDPIRSVIQVLPSLIPATAVAGLLGSVTREILAGARVVVDKSAPTQEQFRATFGKLIQRAREDGNVDRLVFFIDELDRCSPDQVIQVLAAIRHFYHDPHSIFVVAADRAVIELAIQRNSPQATPVNTESPYYSSASEYIDKVFQFQISLPPLRNRRLTRFARDLVARKESGLWHELAAGSKTRRDQLMYVLIPSHVRSPRRVKVLLNNFATNARVAEARGMDWLGRAFEIAKLTVLRTEFPGFGADLHIEPRLPRLVLNPPETPSPRLQELLDRHYLPLPPKSASPGASDDEPSLTPTDPIAARAAPDVRDELAHIERVNLRRYLTRTDAYDDPGRDLLFLEPAGAAVDLDDDAFGQLIESDAIETPETVIAAAADQTPDEQRKAIRVLADMVNQEFGQERANLTTALLGIGALVDYEVTPFREDVLGALKLHLHEEGLQSNHLAGTLAIASKEDDGEGELIAELMEDDRLLATAAEVEQVVLIAPQLPTEWQEHIWDKVAEFYPNSPGVLQSGLTNLPADTAYRLVSYQPLRDAMVAYIDTLDDDDATELVDELFEAADARAEPDEELQGRLLWTLVGKGSGTSYDAAIRRSERLDEFRMALGYRNGLVFHAVELAPAEDWDDWTNHLGPAGRSRWDDESKRARTAIASILRRWPEVTGSEEHAVLALERIAKHVDAGDDAALADVITPLISIEGLAWWTAPGTIEAQGAAYRALLALRNVGPATHRAVSMPIAKDLERALTSRIVAGALQLVRTVAPLVDKQGVERLGAVLKRLTPVAPLDSDLTRARLVLGIARKADRRNPQSAPFRVSPSEVKALLSTSTRQEDLEIWYSLRPPFADGLAIALALGPRARSRERNVVAKWAAALKSSERTELLLELLKLSSDIAAWVEAITIAPVDDAIFVAEIDRRIRIESQGEQREDLARSLAAYRSPTARVQKMVAETILWLLAQDQKVDFNAAVIALGGLGPNHGAGKRLADAFEKARGQGRKLPRRARAHLERARIPVRKRSFPDLFGALRRRT